MTTIFDARKVPVILIILFIVSSGIVFVFQNSQADETAEYPPLPPADSDSPIPYYEGNTVLFILGVIVILAVGWTAFIYYRYFKERKKRRKKMTRNEKKRY
ncbi:MAG: hypothetical protein ACOC89_02285 [Candidatus Saliniplasma sp.]